MIEWVAVGAVGSVLVAFAVIWRWVVKPHLDWKEHERRRMRNEVKAEIDDLQKRLVMMHDFEVSLSDKVANPIREYRFTLDWETVRGKLTSMRSSGLTAKFEEYEGEFQDFREWFEACREIIEYKVWECVRLHLTQTARKWREGKHVHSPNLDEALAHILPEHILREEFPLSKEWLEAYHPSYYDPLSRVVDESESLDVFLRILQNTVKELPCLRVLRIKQLKLLEFKDLKEELEKQREKLDEELEKKNRLLRSLS